MFKLVRDFVGWLGGEKIWDGDSSVNCGDGCGDWTDDEDGYVTARSEFGSIVDGKGGIESDSESLAPIQDFRHENDRDDDCPRLILDNREDKEDASTNGSSWSRDWGDYNNWQSPLSQVYLLRRPDGRPLTEPPIFNYERFERECIPSDKMLKIAFPGNPQKATAYRDTLTEYELLGMFRDWVDDVDSDQRFLPWDSPQSTFIGNLYDEVTYDWKDVKEEHERFADTLTDLEKWETHFIDTNGNFDGVRQRLQTGEDVFGEHPGGNLALAKYSFLLDEMPLRPAHDLATWESFWLDENGSLSAKAKEKRRVATWQTYPHDGNNNIGRQHLPTKTVKFRESVRRNPEPVYHFVVREDLFTRKYFGGEQARIRYHNLFRWELKNLDEDGGTRSLHRRILNGQNVFPSEDEDVFTKWGHLLDCLSFKPNDDIETWERFWQNKGTRDTFALRRLLGEDPKGEDNPFWEGFYGAQQAKSKYKHLKWDARNLDRDMGIKRVKRRVLSGENVFSERYTAQAPAAQAASKIWAHLLNILPFEPNNDIETWEYFHFEEVLNAMERGIQFYPEASGKEGPFNEKYYGAIVARKKYAFLLNPRSNEEKKQEEDVATFSEIPPLDVIRVTLQNASMRQAFNGRLSLKMRPTST